MTPTEKAKELFNKYYDLFPGKYKIDFGYRESKKCSLVALENELKSIMLLSLLCTFDNPMKPHFEQKITELKEVKTEIEKL